MKREFMMISGLGAGAGLMYWLDPDRGRRRRALARDQVTHGLHKSADAVEATSRDLKHRAKGSLAQLGALFRSDSPDDAVLVERVRAKLGRVVSHPRALDVTAEDGRVTLRGPILAHEAARVLSTVEGVRGVREVMNALELHERAENIPALQGGSVRPGMRWELMQGNWAPSTRAIAGVSAAAAAAVGMSMRNPAGIPLVVAGLGLLARSATNLPFARLFGVGAGRRAIDVHKTIDIDAPVDRVFKFWADYDNFPRFMSRVREVRRSRLEGQSHWVVRGPAGQDVHFDAVVTRAIPNELIAWQTIEGSSVAHAGMVRFEPAGRQRTRLNVRMSYNPPAGAIGHSAAAMLGRDLKSMLDEDLLRLKTMIETSRPPHDAARGSGEASTRVH